MNVFADVLWIEFRKALRSRLPLWITLGAGFMPLGIGFLMFVSRNPEISQKLGLISAKANLMAYAGADWSVYMGLFAQMIAAGGFVFYSMIVSWVFGREFVDGTLKDMLAVPVPRAYIVLAKFVLVAVWSLGLTLVVLAIGLAVGAMIGMPGGSLDVIWQGSALMLAIAALTIVVVLPFAFFASAGRGYLLPIGVAILTLMMTNLVVVAGWGETFPWAIPGLISQKMAGATPLNLGIVVLTGAAGIFITHVWWKLADQNR